MRLEQMYQEVILDHYRHPHGRGLREGHQCEVHHVNPTCGDEITLRVQLDEDHKIVRDVSYDAQGCSISQAATSMMFDLIEGKTIDEAFAIHDEFHAMISSRGTIEGNEDVLDDAVALAGVAQYPARVKCALLGWMAFKDAASQIISPTS